MHDRTALGNMRPKPSLYLAVLEHTAAVTLGDTPAVAAVEYTAVVAEHTAAAVDLVDADNSLRSSLEAVDAGQDVDANQNQQAQFERFWEEVRTSLGDADWRDTPQGTSLPDCYCWSCTETERTDTGFACGAVQRMSILQLNLQLVAAGGMSAAGKASAPSQTTDSPSKCTAQGNSRRSTVRSRPFPVQRPGPDHNT